MKSQPDHEAALKQTIGEGLAVIVAGTGISIAASFDSSTRQSHPQASWAGLLVDGLKWLKEHRLIKDAVADAHLTLLETDPQTHRFISAAEDVTEGMGGAGSVHFADWLKRTIGSIGAHDRSVLDALEALRQQGNLLATTNYDGLLLDYNKLLTPVTWVDSDAFIGAVRSRDTERIIFLHGYWRQPKSVILDWKSYERIARDKQYREDLAAFWRTSIWVYVGCGVNGIGDPDFGLLLERYGERARLAGHWDYCLVRHDQRDEFEAHFDRNKLNIRAISFGKSHADLPKYLHSLLPAPLPPAPVALSSSTPAAPVDLKRALRASKIRTLYLKDARRDFEARLAASIHHARFIDLGIQDDPAAVRPAWGYHNPETKQSYDTVAEAFAACDRRLLLLGSPGSGKTTALLHLAKQMVQEAEQSPERPIPFVANLSKFRLEQAEGTKLWLGFGQGRLNSVERNDDERPDTRFEDWLVSEMADFPGLSREMAREWIHQGCVAVLLDGLDEFNDERRADLVRLLNSTFLRYYPDLFVVICSRTNEYLVLRSSDDTRLHLRGCVQLQPLNDQQIAVYLETSQAETLLSALPDDPALRELARTPLTLAMLVLAYGGLPLSNLPRTRSLSESRHHLFESYVARMLQRRERRKRNIPFDDLKANDIPISEYDYHPQHVHRWLGWLALALSIRMRTSFSMATFHSVLRIGVHPTRQPLNFTAIYLAIGVLLMVSLCLIALPIVPISPAGIGCVAVLSVSSVLLLPLAASGDKEWTPGLLFLLFAFPTTTLLATTSLARELCAILPGSMSPLTVSALLPAALFVALFFASEGVDAGVIKLGACFILLTAAVIALQHLPRNWQLPFFDLPWWQTGIAAVGVAIIVSVFVRDQDWRVRVNAFGVSTGIALVVVVAARWIPELSWTAGLIIVTMLLVLTVAVTEVPTAVRTLIGFSLFAFIGSVVAKYRGTILSVSLFGLLCPMSIALSKVSFVKDSRLGQRLVARSKILADGMVTLLERMVLTPCLWQIIAVAQRFPWRRNRFISFCQESFLLKQSSQEFEFVHRLLRDYFALRELRPKLSVPDRNRRLEVIRSLGYQGEAALDVLAEFVEDQDSSVRAAAITGLSHIASPVATHCLRLRLDDRDPLVRQAIIPGIFEQATDARKEMLDQLVPLGDGCELEPLLSCLTTYSSHSEEIYEVIKRMGRVAREELMSRLRSSKKRVRLMAVEVLAQFHDETSRRLLSSKLNGRAPWVDPAKPISKRRVLQCARQLPVTEKDVRAWYRVLADDFRLKVRF